MAILGTFIDIQTVSRAGDDLTGVTLAALNHSLPATNAEMVLPYLRSVQQIGEQPAVNLLGLGSNASQLTVGYAVSTTPSAPTVMYDVVAAVFHSYIR